MRHSVATSFMLIMLSASNVYALSCLPPVPFSQNVFFKGTIVSVDGGPEVKGDRRFVQQGCSWQYQIRVDEPWHGVEKDEVLAVSRRQWICGVRPTKQLDKQYNIALTEPKDGHYTVGMCSDMFFNPYDETGKFKADFKSRLDELNVGAVHE